MSATSRARIVARMALALAVPLLVFACAGRAPRISYETLAQGMTSATAYEKPRFEVIESGQQLARLHERLFAGRLPAPEVPVVDFTSDLVLFVAMAQQPSAGYRVEFNPPRLEGDTLVLEVDFLEPAAGRAVATVMTQPYLLLKVSRPPGLSAVRFVDPEGGAFTRVDLHESPSSSPPP